MNDLIKTPAQNPTIGLLICKGKDNTEVQYAFNGITTPMGVASYDNIQIQKLQEQLPSIEELKARIQLLEEELDKKAKASRITATIHEAKATKERKERKVVRKEDTTKENIIKALAERLEELATEVKIENVGKLITFKLGEDSFKLDLIRQRKPKAKG